MAKVGIFDTPPSKWFKFDSDTEVLLRHIDKGAVNTILMRGAAAAKTMKAKAGHVQDIFLGKEAVLGWRQVGDENKPGFLLPDGTPFPFSPENRNRLMTKSKRFSEWVFRLCSDDQQFLEEEPEELAGDDLKGLDDLLDELGNEEELPGNV